MVKRDIMMNRNSKKILITLSCITALFLAACNSSNVSKESDENDKPIVTEKYYISETPYRIDTLDQAKSISVMKYRMQNVLGKTGEANALLIFPKTAQPTDGWRVVVLEHGTVGVASHCAPSVNSLNDNFRILANELLAKGYVIVAPDYEGLGAPGVHPYLNLASEAKSTLSAIKAINEQYSQQLNGAWVSIGQSQGGQASLAAAEYANNDLQYKGAFAIAPISSFDKVLLDVIPMALKDIEKQEIKDQVALDQRRSVLSYAAMLANVALLGVGIKAYDPQFAYQDLFQVRAKPIATLADGANGFCLQSADPEQSLVQNFKKDIISFMQADGGKSVIDYPGLDSEAFKTNQVIAKFLKDNEPAMKRLDKPVRVIQSKNDLEVPEKVTAEMVNRLVNVLGSPQVGYVVIDAAGQQEVLAWIYSEVEDFLTKYMPAKR